MQRRLLFLFLLSGAAGLIYEVIWVRQFGNIFGNTVSSASLVVAVFVCGLGAGGALAGSWADRRYRVDPLAPLRMYARVELVIAVLGASIALGLPQLAGASGAVSSYSVGEHGWHSLSAGSYLARYFLATVLLLPVTVLMGATLTLLIRFIVAADVAAASSRISVLYAVNTLGAALGCWLTDRVLVPSVGLLSTQWVAVLLNLIAAFGASRLAITVPAPSLAPAIVTADEPRPFRDHELKRVLLTSLAVCLAGFSAMGMEIVWFRHLASMLGGFRSVFSLSLTTILLGIVIGSVAGGWLVKRLQRPVEIFLVAQTGYLATALLSLYFYKRELLSEQILPNLAAYESTSEGVRALWRTALTLKPMLFVVGLPAVMMGCTFPVANACIQRTAAVVGRRAGLLYLANTLGGVAGSLVIGFVVLPAAGSQGSVGLLAVTVALGLVPMFLAGRAESSASRPLSVVFSTCLATAVISAGLWLQLKPQFLIEKSLLSVQSGAARLLTAHEATTELVAVEQTGPVLTLMTNGHPMSGSAIPDQRYMRAFSHIPLLMMPSPERVLVICFGVGNTLHSASLHPSVKHLEVADLSKNVLEHARWFAEVSNHDVLEDPRVSVFINDGRQHLRMSAPESFDLITLEPPPINQVGVSALYSKEFYELARSRLKPGGFLTQWVPAYQVSEPAVRSLVRAFIDVFPQSVLLSGSGRELILMGTAGTALAFDPAQVAQALAARPAVRADLERVWLSTLTELVGTFAASVQTMAEATQDALPLTDDHPMMEYSGLADLLETHFPRDLIDNRPVERFCPRCFSKGRPIAEVEMLPAYLAVFEQYYASQKFLVTSAFPLPERPTRFRIPNAKALIASSPYLQNWAFAQPASASPRPDP